MPADPQSWPSAILAVTSLIVALKAWHGWRLGVVRQAIGLGALAVAIGVGVAGGAIAEPMLDPLLQVPEAARAPLAGLLVAVVVYLAITLFAAVLFKKTEHQTVGLIRFFYGLAGAILGAVAGVLIAAVLLTAFVAASGRPEIFEELRSGNFEECLNTILRAEPPTTAPSRVRRGSRE